MEWNISIDLESIGVNAKFGVDENYEGYELGSSDTDTEPEIEASVVDVESGKISCCINRYCCNFK